MSTFVCSCLILSWLTLHTFPALAQDAGVGPGDPLLLQQQAIARIEGYIEHFRKTGDQFTRRSELEKADQELHLSSELYLQRQDRSSAALSLSKSGDAQRMLNRWEQAVKTYQKAIQLARQAGQPAYEVKALIGLGRAEYLVLKQFDEAARHFHEAATLSEKIGNKVDLANALDLLAQVQEKKGELTAASDTINRALAVAEELKDPKLLLYIYLDRGSIYHNFGRQCDYKNAIQDCLHYLELAKADYEKFTQLSQELGYQGLAKQGRDFVKLADVTAKIHTSKERQLTTLGIQSEKLFQPQSPKDVMVNERFDLGFPKLPPELQQLVKKLRVLAEDSGNRPSQNPILIASEGDILLSEGKNDEALAAYLRAVELLEQDRGRLREEEGRGSYMEDKIKIFYRPLPLLLEQRRFAEAFDLLERSRSRAMADLLATRDPELSSPKERDLYAQCRHLKADIARLQKELHRLIQRTSPPPDLAKTAALEKNILEQEKRLQDLGTRITREAPRLQELMVARPPSLQALQESMRRDGYEVIEYLIQEASLIVWHISADAIKVKSVFVPPEQLKQKVEKLRTSVADRERIFDATMARQLFLYLIEPIKADIKKNQVVIIPHGVLNRIPFQVLQDPADGSFAGERWQISYAPNAAILVKSKKLANLKGERLLAVADPEIAEAPGEVKTIAGFFPGKNKVVTGTVKEADLKSWVGNYSVLHLSVHGKFDAEPLLSSLVLNKATPEEWQLTAAAMFGLPLAKAKLVVLSACETGQMEATQANELFGMIRGLTYARANTLILSSWEVDAAATRLWMETFYRQAQTQPLSEAARQAILAVKSQPHYQHPFYWAPFLMFGK